MQQIIYASREDTKTLKPALFGAIATDGVVATVEEVTVEDQYEEPVTTADLYEVGAEPKVEPKVEEPEDVEEPVDVEEPSPDSSVIIKEITEEHSSNPKRGFFPETVGDTIWNFCLCSMLWPCVMIFQSVFVSGLGAWLARRLTSEQSITPRIFMNLFIFAPLAMFVMLYVNPWMNVPFRSMETLILLFSGICIQLSYTAYIILDDAVRVICKSLGLTLNDSEVKELIMEFIYSARNYPFKDSDLVDFIKARHNIIDEPEKESAEKESAEKESADEKESVDETESVDDSNYPSSY